jgi:hypothetical protein
MLLFSGAYCTAATRQEYTGPKSLGPYSLDRQISIQALRSSLGMSDTSSPIYCFADKKHGLFLNAQIADDHSGRVSSVLLSSFPNCRHLPIASVTIDPEVWLTDKRIGIGSTKGELTAAYGKPSFADAFSSNSQKYAWLIKGKQRTADPKISTGDSTFLYSCLLTPKQACNEDSRSSRMGFSRGKVVWILASNSE